MTRPRPPGLLHRAQLAALTLLALLALPRDARAGDPDRVYRTLETPHFRIHFYVGEGHLAARLSVVAEGAWKRLTAVLDHRPKGKVEVVITDDTDDSNGSATAFPYPTIRLYMTAPDDRSELNDYDDWLTALFTHEFTHIVHLDTTHQVARVVNWILGWGEWGRIYVPNQFQPRFVIEGLAVFEETEQTSAGRLRSTIYDMWMRTATLEGRFQRLDQVTNDPIAFPRGAAAYLYGSAFLRYVAKRFGEERLTKMSHEMASTWIPGSMNRVLKRVVGSTFADLWAPFRASMEERYRRQLEDIRATGETPSRVLTAPRETVQRPIFTHDGQWVLWSDSDGYSRPQIRKLHLDGTTPCAPPPKLETYYIVDAANGTALSPDDTVLYLEAEEPWKTNYAYRDLFAVDPVKKERVRLTHGLRASEPALSPDGRTLAFVVNDAGARSLVTMPVSGMHGDEARRVTLLGNHDDFGQVYTPDWSPDGKRVAFSWWRSGGWRDIWVIDVATRALQRITSDRALDLDPRFSPDGKYLYFSSDRSGVYDLYAYEFATTHTFRVSNVVGGAFDVAIAPDGKRAVYVGFQADGWRLEAIPLDPSTWPIAAPALMDRPDENNTVGSDPTPSHAYWPWQSAWPRYFVPTSYTDAFGQILGVSVSGGDTVGLHSYSLSIGFDPLNGADIPISVGYSYSGFYPSLSLDFSRALNLRGGLYLNGRDTAYVEDDYTGSASMDIPLLRAASFSSDLSFGYSLSLLRPTGQPRITYDPNQITPQLPETGWFSTLGMGWSWSNTHRYTYSVSAEEGRAFSIALSASLKAIGSQYDVYSASWTYAELVPLRLKFLPLDWQNQVLALSYSGGISGGDVTRRGNFYLGTYAPQPDALKALITFSRPGNASLRGYGWASIHGDQFHVWNAEWRFPIAWIERGSDTFPAYIRRLHGAVFTDVGGAFNGTPQLSDVKVGAGAELRLELFLFWYLPAALQLGYAHGFMTGGADQVYLYLNNPF